MTQEKTTTVGPEPDTFASEFTEEIQQQIVEMMIFDKEAFLKVKDLIRPGYFENPVLTDLAGIILAYREKYHQCIGIDEITQELDKHLSTSRKPLPREVYSEQFAAILENGYKQSVEYGGKGFQFILDQVTTWLKYQEVKAAILKSINLLQKKQDYQAIKDMIVKACDWEAGDKDKERVDLDLERIGSIQEEPIEWLWKNVVPFGMLTIVSGDPSVGKSFFAIELASRLSTGRPFPGCATGVTGNTIYMIKELPKKQVLKPRFVAAGADMDRIERLTGHYVKQKEFMVFDTNKNMELLERHVAEHPEVRLVVIDPIISFVTETADLNAPGRARHAMDRLAEFAEKTGLAVVVIMHLNKDQTQKLISRTSGSHQLLAASMFGWVVAKDPEDKDRRLVMPSKNNAGPMDEEEAWVFRIHGFEYTTADGKRIETGKAEFEDETAHGVDAAGIVSPEAIVGTSMTAEAKRWLIIELQNGPVLARELYDRGELAGFSSAVLASAKRQLGIRHDKEGYQGASRWFLPDKYLPKERGEDLTGPTE